MAFGKKWKHETGSGLYFVWRNMRRRCSNPNDDSYARYGGRGVKVCEEWQQSFDAFADWALSHGYQNGLSLDRIDFNGNYEPSNCRWITMAEQHNNECRNVFIEHDGAVKTISQWCAEIGFDERLAHKRYNTYNAKTFDEIFHAGRLSTLRAVIEENECEVCKVKESKKWRRSLCANCYARALRWSKKSGHDIAGYAQLVEKRLGGSSR